MEQAKVSKDGLSKALYEVGFFASPVFGGVEDEPLQFANSIIEWIVGAAGADQGDVVKRVWYVQMLLGEVSSSLLEKDFALLDDDKVDAMVGRRMTDCLSAAQVVRAAIAHTLNYPTGADRFLQTAQRMAEMQFTLGVIAQAIAPFE